MHIKTLKVFYFYREGGRFIDELKIFWSMSIYIKIDFIISESVAMDESSDVL